MNAGLNVLNNHSMNAMLTEDVWLRCDAHKVYMDVL